MLAESPDSGGVKIEPHFPFDNLRHVLGRNEAVALQETRRDGEPVEDVLPGVADDLLNLAYFASVGCDDPPASLNDEPRNRIGH